MIPRSRSGAMLQHVAATRKPHDTWHDPHFGLRLGLGPWWVVATCNVDLLTPACNRRPAETGCRAVHWLTHWPLSCRLNRVSWGHQVSKSIKCLLCWTCELAHCLLVTTLATTLSAGLPITWLPAYHVCRPCAPICRKSAWLVTSCLLPSKLRLTDCVQHMTAVWRSACMAHICYEPSHQLHQVVGSNHGQQHARFQPSRTRLRKERKVPLSM